ncbi:MAG: hypothetical protein ACJATT_005686 [Myxococcota bacterium]|jgi:hypothetical protein
MLRLPRLLSSFALRINNDVRARDVDSDVRVREDRLSQYSCALCTPQCDFAVSLCIGGLQNNEAPGASVAPGASLT